MKNLWIIFILVVFSCENDTVENERLYEDVVKDAWVSFENKEYTKAITLFTNAYEKNREGVDALIGLGWSYMLDSKLEQAISKLNLISGNHNEVMAALAYIHHFRGNYTQSNSSVDNLLTSKPDWSFKRGLNLNIKDLHVLQGQNYFLLGSYSESLKYIQKVDATFNADVLTFAGRSKLANKIEQLNSSALPLNAKKQ